MSKTEFIWPVRVYYEDTDAGGVVYHANYLNYLERARTEFLRQLGYEQDLLLEQGMAFVVRKVDIDYLRPARFNDQLQVSAKIVTLKRSTIVFEQLLTCQGELCAKAEVVVVCVDMNKFKPCSIPETMKEDFLSVS